METKRGFLDAGGKVVGRIIKDRDPRTNGAIQAIMAADKGFTSELNLEQLVRKVTQVAVELTGAEIGAFFYEGADEGEGRLKLHTIVGADPKLFEGFNSPRATEILDSSSIVRSSDVTKDPRFSGLPAGHLPVASYLGVPVNGLHSGISGLLIFGHSETGVFTQQSEKICAALAERAAAALDNARLFRQLQTELSKRHEAEEELKILTSLAPSIIFSRDQSGKVLYISDYWYAFTGADPKLDTYAIWRESVHPEDIPVLDKAWRHSVATGEDYVGDARIRKHDGTYEWFQSWAVPQRDDAGNVVRWMGNATNIHRQKVAEENLSRINANLEQEIQSRARELEVAQEQVLLEMEQRQKTQDALRQAQKMESVGQLTGGIAHDFNNMLTVISGNLELIKLASDSLPGGPQSDRITRFSSMALEAASKAEKLTAQLLAFSRKSKLQPERLKANEVVLGVRDMIQRAVGVGIKCDLKLQEDLWLCLSDRAQLESALLNLTINARDAMPNGGDITITTSNRVIHQVDGDAKFVSVRVTDTGTGMSKDVLSKVFEPFFTTKDVGKGSGLGLSMVYGFTQQSNGKVFIESEPGQGTSVDMLFPFSAGEVIVEETEDGSPEFDAKRRTVLVVDDEPGVRELACQFLTEMGFKTIAAQDGVEALTILEATGSVDLLFTDVMMPNGIDGLELARRTNVIYPQLPVIFTTGHADEVLKRLRQDGGGGIKVLGKPYRMKDLESMVEQVLHTENIEPQAPTS